MQKRESKRSNRSKRRLETRRHPTDRARPDAGAHQGAVETDVTQTTPPDNRPDNQTGGSSKASDDIDPADELTPG
jgi:hypothetical protein